MKYVPSRCTFTTTLKQPIDTSGRILSQAERQLQQNRAKSSLPVTTTSGLLNNRVYSLVTVRPIKIGGIAYTFRDHDTRKDTVIEFRSPEEADDLISSFIVH